MMKKTGYQTVFLLYTFYGLSELSLLPIISACTYPHWNDAFIRTEIDFKYNRDDVAIYTYPNTTSVNIFIDNFELIIKHILKNSTKEFPKSVTNAVALGVGNKVGNNISDCNFFIGDLLTEEIIDSYENEYNLSETCLHDAVCRSFGDLGPEAYERAESRPRDFDSISLLSPNFMKSHKKLHPPCTNLKDTLQNIACNVNERIRSTLVKEYTNGLLNFKYPTTSGIQTITINGTDKYIINYNRINFTSLTKQNISFEYYFYIPTIRASFKLQEVTKKPSDYIPNPDKIQADFNDLLFEVRLSLKLLSNNECNNEMYELRKIGDPVIRNYVYNSKGGIVPVEKFNAVTRNNENILNFIVNKFSETAKNVIEYYDCTFMK